MKTANIGQIAADIPNGKKGKFNLSHDVNTTYDWGSVQPLFCKMMLPDSSLNIEIEQLKRLAPMVVPTFGRVKNKNIAHFIPMDQIWPNWQAMLSQTKVTRSSSTATGEATSSTYIPKYVPYIRNCILTMFTLVGARVNLYFSGAVGTIQENSWTCARNKATFANPTWSAATVATRKYINKLLDMSISETPATDNIQEFHYTGYSMNPQRLCMDSRLNRRLFTNDASQAGNMPAITTMVSKPLQNANGNGYTHSASNEQNTYDASIGDEHISFEGADMIWEYAGANGTGIESTERTDSTKYSPIYGVDTNEFDGCKIRLTFKLSSFGKRLRKTLIGLGYNINLSDDTDVSLLPLIAEYKAWWDSYAPERYKNFYETAAWKLINTCMQTQYSANVTSALQATGLTPQTKAFKEFIADLGTCFATEKIDAVSAATDDFYTNTNTTTNANNNSITETILATLGTIMPIEQGGEENSRVAKSYVSSPTYPINAALEMIIKNGEDISEKIKITQPQLDALKKAYIALNKSSVAGMKVEEILKALGQGDYVEECKGRFINGSDDLIKISDVIATAATEDAKLGQYGGRGLGISNMQISYNAKNHGYLIILSCVIPESGYINAPAHENTAINFEKMFQPEFDGISYEAIQKKCFAGSPLINDKTCNDTFGFLPTYTQWKFMTNKANGDFSLNSMKTSMRPYTLDKYIPVDDVGVYKVEETNGHSGSTTELCTPTYKYSDTPNAGEDWRYINKFPWNGDFNRIFAASDDGIEWSVFSPNNNAFLYLSFEFDNIMVHNVLNVTYWAHMKEIEESYNTYDHEHGAPNSTIQRS